MTTLGIIAGAGDLPIAIAQSASEAGKPVFIVALRGIADEAVQRFPHDWIALGEMGRTFSALRKKGCAEVLLAGKVSRPKWSELRPDATALMRLPKIMAAATKGDDALLRCIVTILEEQGFKAISVADAAPALLAPAGALGARAPSARDLADISLASDVVEALGKLDVGQAAIVCEGLVLAVEAAEGTDAMIARVAQLPENLRGSAGRPRGVLYKGRKPTQDGKTDLPVIGPETVRRAAAVSLCGIAVEADAALIVHRDKLIEDAERAKMFVFGFRPGGNVPRP